MGQKIHPIGFRLPVTRAWSSRWFANNRNFSQMLAEDLNVRDYLKKKLKNAAVARILIERPAKNARITIYSARPGVVIGKKGEDIEALKLELAKRLGVPVALANARLSERSARGYARFARLTAPMLAQMNLIAVQTEAEAARFRALGARAACVH